MCTPLITRARAAQIIGVSTNTIDRLIEQGHLVPRTEPPRGGKPSLDPNDVRAVAEQRAVENAYAERRRQKREGRRITPPDGELEWLTASQAARVLGVTEQAVFKRTRNGTIPYVAHSGRRWYRADQVELAARARRARLNRLADSAKS